jgi:hypothetical protein
MNEIRMKPVYVSIHKSNVKGKKYTAVFYDKDMEEVKRTQFGAKGMSDYTIHKDEERKQRYLDRHRKNENWNDFESAGSLSRFLLWNLPTLKESFEDYLKRFDLKALPT